MGGRGGGSSIASKAATPSAAAAPAAPAPAAPVATPSSHEAAILQAFDRAQGHYLNTSFKFLADVQEASGLDRETFVSTLKDMDRARRIQLDPDPDAKNVTARERDAGFRFGGKLVTMMRPI